MPEEKKIVEEPKVEKVEEPPKEQLKPDDLVKDGKVDMESLTKIIAKAEQADKDAKHYRDQYVKRQDQFEKLKKETEDKDKAAEREKLDELDRMKLEKDEALKKAEDATGLARKVLIESKIVSAASIETDSRKRFNDPTDVVRLLGNDFELDDSGNPIGVEEKLNEIAKAKPYLLVNAGQKTTVGVVPVEPPAQPEVKREKPDDARDAFLEHKKAGNVAQMLATFLKYGVSKGDKKVFAKE